MSLWTLRSEFGLCEMQFSKCNIIFTLSQECFLILLQQAPSVISCYFGFLWLKPRPDFSGNSGGSWEKLQGRFSGLSHCPHGMFELRKFLLKSTMRCASSTVHMYKYTYKLWLYDSSSFAFYYLTITSYSKHCIRKICDTEMDGYHCFTFTGKLSYKV
jgi:hypothetical protein